MAMRKQTNQTATAYGACGDNVVSVTVTANSSTTLLAQKYIREFSTQAANFRSRQSPEALALLNRSASLLSTTISPHQFNPGTHLEVAKFFIDLHAMIGALSVDADALWACLSLLQHCAQNLEARRAIIEDYRFVPLLTYVLKRTQAQDKIQRLLMLLQELTYGIHITWEEPYIVVLLELLVNNIALAVDEREEGHACLALSILINLCYKNFVVLFLFMRSVNISNFARRIQDLGMLANKMLIILSEDIHAPDARDLQSFLRSTFASVDECIKLWNVPQLRHMVDFLTDAKSHNGLYQAMLDYDYYCEDIERILDQMVQHSDMNDNSDELREHKQICMGLLFTLIRHILMLSTICDAKGDENVVSLDALGPRIFELACNWIESDICGVEAVNLCETLITLVNNFTIVQGTARDPSIVVHLISLTERSDTSPKHATAVLQLLLALLQQSKTEKLILTKITESYFDKILAPLLAMKLSSPITSLSMDEIEKSVFCLLLLISFAGIAKKAYFEKCRTHLLLPQIQYALARGMISGNEKLCCAVFQISQFEHFPQSEVATHIAKLNSSPAQNSSTFAAPAQVANCTAEQWRNLNVFLKSHKSLVSKEFEERLQALIEIISKACTNNQLNNVGTSQIIELFNYKIEKLTHAEISMQKRLEDASTEVTDLTQRIALQNAELQKYHTMNFELHINMESLQTQCKDLTKQKDTIRRNMTEVMKKLSEQAESLQISEKRLAVKISEAIVLQKDCSDMKAQLHDKKKELEHLQSTTKENATRIEKFKKTIAAYEMEIKEKQRLIDEKNRDLIKTHKALDEQSEAKKKSDGIINVLESQLQEKNEQIHNYELELSETEELRKTILSLMESKKPKRKT